jgi:DNA-binding response OmpR family regulator
LYEGNTVKNPFRKSEEPTPEQSILVFATEANDAQTVAQILNVNGYRVDVVHTVAAAIELLDTQGLPDLFIFDCLYPEVDVNDFLTRARLRFGQSVLPSILVLMDAPNDEQVANVIQAQDVLQKPYEDTLLLERSRQLIDRQQPKNIDAL